MKAFRPGKTKPKIKKLEKDIETPKVAPVTKLVVDAVGDIFADAGKYTPQIDTVRTPAVSNEGTNKTSYFKSAVTENTEEETRSRASVMATVKALMQTQGGVARVATETRKRVFDDATGEADEGRQLVIEETGKVAQPFPVECVMNLIIVAFCQVHRDIIGGTIGHIGGEVWALLQCLSWSLGVTNYVLLDAV